MAGRPILFRGGTGRVWREMAKEFKKSSMYMDQTSEALENGHIASKSFDDDGRLKRTVIGSGVLSLAWAIAQLGWVAGPAVLMAFSFITYFTSTLLADSYRCPGPLHGTRNYTYMDVVRSHLGGFKVQLCGLAQYANLVGVTIGYTITASISMVAVKRSNCFHTHGHDVECSISNYPFMITFAAIQIILSQIPNFHELSWLSIVAAVMSFAYSSIGLGLSIAKVAGGTGHVRTTLTGTTVGVDVSASDKVWRSFQAIGDIAFAYAYSTVLIEIQAIYFKPQRRKGKTEKDASRNICIYAFGNVMRHFKVATTREQGDEEGFFSGVSTTTVFYVLCGCVGYAAFGNKAPGNFLTGFGFYEPFWLIDFANVCIAVHLIGAYQASLEDIVRRNNSRGRHDIPVFQRFLGPNRAASFYPLTVYFPIEMHIAQAKIPKYSFTWMWLKILSWACLIVSLVAAAGSLQGLAHDVKKYKPFKTQ
ncbi:hypothetical protein DH2020_035700 [Rehmannia glutinosa]|uniref:Amino acid transporter transmembrane domain-containing protein n=1 Tax=Rehmannia glutinosa TaxID=99300 RepID=A0ABR0V5N6_REHGL